MAGPLGCPLVLVIRHVTYQCKCASGFHTWPSPVLCNHWWSSGHWWLLWAAKWNFTFAPTKLSGERQPTTPDPYLGQSEMTVEQDLDILGITIERKLLWTSQLEHCVKLPVNQICLDDQLSTKLRYVVLWNTSFCLGEVLLGLSWSNLTKCNGRLSESFEWTKSLPPQK